MSFRGKQLRVEGVGHATSVTSLKEKLEELTTVPVANQKLVRAKYSCFFLPLTPIRTDGNFSAFGPETHVCQRQHC